MTGAGRGRWGRRRLRVGEDAEDGDERVPNRGSMAYGDQLVGLHAPLAQVVGQVQDVHGAGRHR